ncbi:MAG: hypothetical protein Kow0059_07840 [Candidatus Sumerlaeia bacterium]
MVCRSSHRLLVLILVGLGLVALAAPRRVGAEARLVPVPAGGLRTKALNPKISTALAQAISNYRALPPLARSRAEGLDAFLQHRQYLITEDGRIQVYIWLKDWATPTLEQLRAAGVRWSVDDSEQFIVQALVPFDLIETIASLERVRAVTLPLYPKFHVGNAQTQGDMLQQSQAVREQFLLSGEGVKVGVISDGFADGALYAPPVAVFESCSTILEIEVETGFSVTVPDPNTCDLPPVVANQFLPDHPKLDACVGLLGTVDDKPTTITDTTPGLIPGAFGKVFYRSFIDPEFIRADFEQGTGDPLPSGYDELQPILITTGSEGTAMLEIVHDIAPRAQLYFSNFFTSLEFNRSKDWLAAQGCDVICDDIGFIGDGPLDGTSPTSRKNAELTARGISYVTAAGNLAELHYRSRFVDDPAQPNGIHNFALPSPNAIHGDETLEMTLVPGQTYAIALVWQNEFGNARDDFDLFLLDSDTLDLHNPLAFSIDKQGPGAPGLNNPFEFLIFNNSSGFSNVSLVITRKDLTPSFEPGPLMDVFFWFGFESALILDNQYLTPLGAIANNNDAGGNVISVGAISAAEAAAGNYLLESFSSHGPTWDGRRKPELCSFDGVRTMTQGFSTFFGTSAAAPHVAGAVALLKEYYPQLSPAQARSYLMAAAVDMYPGLSFPALGIADATGPDDLTGAGYIDLLKTINFFEEQRLAGFTPVSRRFTFDSDAEGWVTQSLAGFGIPAPVFAVSGGALTMQGGGQLSFGSWISPRITFPSTTLGDRTALLGDAVYVMRANISSTAGAEDFPQFRLRLSNFRNETVAERVIVSMPGNTLAPGAGRDYFVYFEPDPTNLLEGLFAAIDLLNFDPDNDLNATMFINEVEISEVYTNTP